MHDKYVRFIIILGQDMAQVLFVVLDFVNFLATPLSKALASFGIPGR